MHIRVIYFLIVLLTPILISKTNANETASKMMPPVPIANPGTRPMLMRLVIGPREQSGPVRQFFGKISVIAVPPREVAAESIEFFVDDKFAGIAKTKPYMIEIDSSAYSEGEHSFKAVAKDNSGKEIWAGITKANTLKQPPQDISSKPNTIQLNNGNQAVSQSANTTMDMNKTKSILDSGNNSSGNGLLEPDDINPLPNEPRIEPQVVANTEPTSDISSASKNVSISKVYSNKKYGFKIKYPNNWVVQDETSNLKPKAAGAFWITFGTKPISKSQIVINLRYKKLDPNTDAEKFAKFNSYVENWNRKDVLGSTAFYTSGGSAELKRVVHRLILIKNNGAWMFNCIDTTGKNDSNSINIFNEMINSLEIF